MTQKYQVKVSMKQAAIIETGIVLKQGDFGMQIEIEVLDFDATGTTPQIVFRKAMGAVESTTITVSSNKYTYTFKGTELDTPGKVFCDLKLKNSTTQRISTASFMFKVVADTLDGLTEETSSYSDTIAQIVGGFDGDINALQGDFANIALIGKNKFNAKWENGKGLNGQGQEVVAVRNGLCGYVAVEPSTVYTAKVYGDNLTFTNLYVAFFQANKSFISSPASVTTKSITFTTPANCAYIRLMTYQAATTGTGLVPEKTQVELGSTATDYEEYGYYFIKNDAIITDKELENAGQAADAKATGDILKNISMVGKNKFDGTWENGKGLNGQGQEVVAVRNGLCGYVAVEPSTVYTAKVYGDNLTFTNLYVAFFQANKSFISSPASVTTKSITFTTPANCAYIRLMTYQAATTGTGLVPEKTQVELGSTATDYEEYGYILSSPAVMASLLDIEPTKKLYNPLTLVHSSLVLKENEDPYVDAKVLYQAKSIKIKADGTAAVGLEWYLRGFQSGNVIRINGTRSTGNNFFVRIIALTSNGTTITQAFYSIGEVIAFIIPENTDRVNITMAACWGTALTENTEVTFTNIKIEYESVPGFGFNYYTGDKISLTDEKKDSINKCNISTWKNFIDVEEYNLYKAQGMEIYNDYVFIFKDGGGGIVLDFPTKNIIASFDTEPISNNHQNCANFTNLFYSDGDEFPLILISRCIGGSYDECLIYRITRNNTSFTFTLINSIRFDSTSYGITWGIDLNNRKLVFTGLFNGNWQVTANNPIYVAKFDLPSFGDIVSGNEIILNWPDIVSLSILPHQVPQGITVHNGNLYSAVQVGASKNPTIWRIDVEKNQIINTIKLPLIREPEDIVVYNNKMYVSQVDSTDTAGNNPLTISEIVFD